MKVKNTEWTPHFIAVPREVLTCPSLNPTDCFVYGAVYFLQSLKEKKCFASNKMIGGLIGKSDRTVSTSLTKLEEAGLVKRHFFKGENNGLHRKEIVANIPVSATPDLIQEHDEDMGVYKPRSYEELVELNRDYETNQDEESDPLDCF